MNDDYVGGGELEEGYETVEDEDSSGAAGSFGRGYAAGLSYGLDAFGATAETMVRAGSRGSEEDLYSLGLKGAQKALETEEADGDRTTYGWIAGAATGIGANIATGCGIATIALLADGANFGKELVGDVYDRLVDSDEVDLYEGAEQDDLAEVRELGSGDLEF